MSPVLRLSRTPDDPTRVGTIELRDAGISARAHPCSSMPGMAVVVVPDGSAVPAPEHFHRWARTLADHGYTSMRTGALSIRQSAQAERAGLRCVQQLSLLELARSDHREPPTAANASPAAPPPAHRGRDRSCRVRPHVVARRGDARRCVQRHPVVPGTRRAHRSGPRAGAPGHDIVGFLISGRAGRTGYVQRLAVHPTAHRHGVATDLLLDSLRWMRRARLQRVFVNTHVDNAAALALYRGAWVRRAPGTSAGLRGPDPSVTSRARPRHRRAPTRAARLLALGGLVGWCPPPARSAPRAPPWRMPPAATSPCSRRASTSTLPAGSSSPSASRRGSTPQRSAPGR